MPLDSKTHRNLGYSFIQFNTIEDLIFGYECVRPSGGALHVAAGEDVAQVRVYEEVPFLLREDSGRPERCVGRSGECVEEEFGGDSIGFCIFMSIIRVRQMISVSYLLYGVVCLDTRFCCVVMLFLFRYLISPSLQTLVFSFPPDTCFLVEKGNV